MSEPHIEINIAGQRLRLIDGDTLLAEYTVSTALKGAGEQLDSGCTPRGLHEIADCIGEGCEINAVFIAREPTGEIYDEALAAAHPGRDWILTRIMVLSGLEPGKNQAGDVDTWSRFIYIHGTPDSVELGAPGSHGCVRMHNTDVVRLFECVEKGTRVLISD